MFHDVAREAGVDNPTGRSLSASWAEFDGDGWPDLYVANDVSDNAMFANLGGSGKTRPWRGAWAPVRRAIGRELGLRARLMAPLVGAFLLAAMSRETLRLRRGRIYEPPTFYETNRPGERVGRHRPSPGRWVTAEVGATDPPEKSRLI